MTDGEKKNKENRKSAVFFIVMNDGQIHVCKGKYALDRVLNQINPDLLKKIIKGYECKIVPKTKLTIET